MAKLRVIDEQGGARMPFLRGKLTSSLQRAGLPFHDAYQLAVRIRDGLDDGGEVTVSELRESTIAVLTESHPGKVLRRYRRPEYDRENVQVVYSNEQRVPFSRGIHARRLEICALPRNKCNAIARLIHDKLVHAKQRSIGTHDLTAQTFAVIERELDAKAAEQYLILNDFIDNDRPLLVLLGGVAGTGKSTIATDLANGLGIVRTQSTDMLREVMRVLIPKRVSPALHTSSFAAGEAVEGAEAIKDDATLLYGFGRQSELVEVACQAVLQRALNERVSMILEGVHVRPAVLQHIPESDAVIVPFMLGVLNRKTLESRIKGRRVNTRPRRAARYLQRMDDIWQLQSALLSEADAADIPILDNQDRYETGGAIIKTIVRTIAGAYSQQRIAELRGQYSS